MATKTKTKSKTRKAPAADKIIGLAELIVTTAAKKKDPGVDIPLRALSNARYNKDRRIIEMGTKKQARNFFNLSQARSFMQTVLIASGCKRLIDENKTSRMRAIRSLKTWKWRSRLCAKSCMSSPASAGASPVS